MRCQKYIWWPILLEITILKLSQKGVCS